MNGRFPRDCRVLITGGTGSIGRALVEAFHDAGTNVSFQYCRNITRAEDMERTFGAKAIQWDFNTGPMPIADRVDVLVNNAGINISKLPVDSTTDEEWDETLLVNLKTPMALARQVLPQMKVRGWGRIINISSIYGFRVTSNNLAYNVSPHCLSALSGSTPKAFGRLGIACNMVGLVLV